MGAGRKAVTGSEKKENQQVAVSKEGDWGDNFISGASASLCSKVFLQPFDTSKTVLQAAKDVRGDYSNLAQCMVGLVRNKGFGALYTGFLASIAVSAPSSAVFAAGYEFSKNAIEKAASNTSLPLLQLAPVLAAAFGNVVASVVRVPPEIIKQRVQAGIHRNVFEATRAVWEKEGFTGFYRGYSAMVARDIPYSALQFMTFEILKERRRNAPLKDGKSRQLKKGKDIINDLWMGAIAGAVASSLTTPLDVVKTRVMTQAPAGRVLYTGLGATVKQIWLEEGIVGFGRGLLPRVLYKVPASAVFLVCYEAMKRILSSARVARQIKTCSSQKVGSKGVLEPEDLFQEMDARKPNFMDELSHVHPLNTPLTTPMKTNVSAATPL